MREIDFRPSFQRYPPAIATHLVRIGSAQAVVDTARILPPQEDILRVSALAETVHFSNLLEGNQLSRIESERALRHELDARGRAEVELVNYVAALELIERGGANGEIRYDIEYLLELHGLITRGLGRDGESFEPRHEGAWRDGVAVIPNALGVVEHHGVSSEEVDGRMRGLFSYLRRNHDSEEYPGPVLAAVTHHAITDLHPFADGNGRAARAMALAVLINEGVMPKRLSSPDRHYALDKGAYIVALRSAKRPGATTTSWSSPGNLEQWLLYYVDGLATSIERTASRVAVLNGVADRVSAARLQLTATQEHAVSILSAGERASLTRREYEELEKVGESKARREIEQLVKARLLASSGTGRGVRYRLPGTSDQPSKWNRSTIETALREFLRDRDTWPTRQEFLDAGLGGLYVAMSRSGGVRSWAERVGL